MTTATTIGEQLFATVERYAGVAKHHRSGTPEGDGTAEWFAGELRSLGARVKLQTYEFRRFEPSWEVRLDGEPVPSLPYWYAGNGPLKTDRVLTDTQEIHPPAELPARYAALEARAREAGAAATVTATLSPCGELFAHNSAIREPSPMPHLGVAGKYADRLASAKVEVEFDARVVPGRAANVIAELGDGDPAQTVVLATPLSAWFRSAGERGSGIALCLEVARQLAKVARVRVVGTTCHELSHDGLHAYLAGGAPPCRGIIHFGGSSVTVIADDDGRPRLNPRLIVRGWLGDERRADLERIYGTLNRPVLSPAAGEHRTWPGWMGEAVQWSSQGVPLVSHSGRGPYTHTDHDLPHLATAPLQLQDVFECDIQAARLMAGLSGS